jgi:hypothetical protein
MRQSILILALLLGLNATANSTKNNVFPSYLSLDMEKLELEDKIFATLDETTNDTEEIITVESIEVIELEEEVDIDFDTAEYLPEGFNALDGKNDIDWDKIELVEIEEEVELGFNPKDYLPKGFDPYKGMHRKHTIKVVSIH